MSPPQRPHVTLLALITTETGPHSPAPSLSQAPSSVISAVAMAWPSISSAPSHLPTTWGLCTWLTL